MAIDLHQHNKQTIAKFRAALYDYDELLFQTTLQEVFRANCVVHLSFPWETLDGPQALCEQAYQPLIHAMPDLERRDYIVIAGSTQGENWVGCAGCYLGTLESPWLNIPATRYPVTMRFHEFFRFEEGQVVEMQAIWDLPEIMLQAKVWPMTPSLGVEWLVPGPATQDGIVSAPYDEKTANASVQLVKEMLEHLGKFATEGVEGMKLAQFWHPKMNWYGPAGIGSNRKIAGFRKAHQIPFLNAMPNRIGNATKGFLFGDGNYVGFTAWPGMTATISHDGWLGIAPAQQQITMRSLDFWRCAHGKIRENWVLVDLLDVYHQIGVDVFARMQEML